MWAVGCTNMAFSWALSAYSYHAKGLDDKGRLIMGRAVHMHQGASIGFMILANIGAPIIPTTILTIATILFPGVVYYETLKKTKIPGKLVPMGGMLQMVFWVVLSFYW